MVFVNIFFAMSFTYSAASLNRPSSTYSEKKRSKQDNGLDAAAARERGLQNTIPCKKRSKKSDDLSLTLDGEMKR